MYNIKELIDKYGDKITIKDKTGISDLRENNYIENLPEKFELKQGDIIYVDLGEGEDYVQGGERPCIVLQNNIGNKHSPTTIVAPISSKIKVNKSGNIQPTHFIIENYEEVGLECPSAILFEQIRTISKKKIMDKFPKGHIPIEQIEKCIKIALGLN